MSIDFVDASDPLEDITAEIYEKCKVGHWKSAVRRLRRIARRFPSSTTTSIDGSKEKEGSVVVPEELYVTVLECCARDRLSSARAAESARKVMERLVETSGSYFIPDSLGNYCIDNCLGSDGKHSTHQGFGGLDTALAMVSAMERSGSPVYLETYEKVAVALAKEGSMTDCLSLLQKLVVEKSEQPTLATFVAIAEYATNQLLDEPMITLLSYVKAAGYALETLVATYPVEGTAIIANAVIAAERIEKDALVFRLLNQQQPKPPTAESATTADQAGVAADPPGVVPSTVVNTNKIAKYSSAAERACTLVHKRAIVKATENGEWKTAVKVLELMIQRQLRPSPWIWRNVVACCARAEKSKRATALLFDWIKLAKAGKAEVPPLSVFNTCINACEICKEQDLTVLVLEAMNETHNTEGNLITFNIALKRLARLGNYPACEGIIIGMLQSGVEPSVVSYTTAIAACASSEPKQPAVAYQWLQRMRSRQVKPNAITYNTALAACADNTLNGSNMGSTIAQEMLDDVDEQLGKEDNDADEADSYKNVLPNAATKVMARKLMQQLKSNWKEGAILKKEATETVRIPLLKLVDFQKSAAAEVARQRAAREPAPQEEEKEAKTAKKVEIELEIESLSHRIAEV
jgi:hypothetical protein